MSKDSVSKVRPQVVKLEKALKVAEAWVNNMSASTADEMTEVEFEGRPSRLGLGAKFIPRSNVAALTDPVEKKLRAKLDAEKKRAAKYLESNTSERNDEHSDDDDSDLESRTNAFAKKRAMALATTLQAKKKQK